MTFSVSPAINVREFDLTTGVPQLSTSEAAIGGVFRWGPIEKRVLVDSENMLVSEFGGPTNFNPETFFTAASFLAYGNLLWVSRAANTSGASPIVTATTTNNSATVTVSNTANLTVGMIAIDCANAQIKLGTTIATIVNSTAFTVPANSSITGTGVATIQFISNNSVFSAFSNTGAGAVSNFAAQIVKNEDLFLSLDGTFDSDVRWLARYPGAMGNSLRVSVCDSANAFTSSLNLASYGNGGATVALNVGSNVATVTIAYVHDGTSNTTAQTATITAASNLKGNFNLTDLLVFGNSSIGTQSLKVVSVGATTSNVNGTMACSTFTINFQDELRVIDNQSLTNTLTRYWEFYDLIDLPPGQSSYVRANGNNAAYDELHVVVVDELGKFSGIPGTVLETYKNLSRATDAKGVDGGNIYLKNVINNGSAYVYFTNDRTSGWSANISNIASVSNTNIWNNTFGYGQDGSDEATIAMAPLIQAFNMFASAEEVDVSLLLQGKARGGTNGAQLANHLIDNICEIRKDCVAFISPDYFDVVGLTDQSTISANIVQFRNSSRASSYGFMDCGYKYMYDRYNDLYRWIPLNGDMAGLAVRTDYTNDPWWSFAGYNRGNIKNYIRLAWSPRKAYRDQLYKNDINPVIQDKANTILFGDKTMLGKESAFSRINVRRLFIVIEKAIATASKYFLFEFNDDFTRAQFRSVVIPYLREIQGRRGIQDFVVVCDKTNNTPELIDLNTLVGDIYIKPARSINYINLNFVAVRTGVSFNEVIGKFGG